ncbi:MAG: MFS transporter [Cyclobacteriaceae bacterium]|nr:MFS transporter [Cyclobacteriaceae bacterium]UYN88402.1 MAG: MFS transporter [Cyclobacteriaceae bacterium]
MNYPRIAVKIIFFLNGFIHANLYSRLPRVQEQFAIDNGTLGFVLLASSIGAIGAMPFTGWFIIRFGSRRITLFSVFFYCLLVPFVPWAFNLAGLVILFFLMGISAGMLDVSMNAQAVMVEKELGKPIMTSFHALFSIGMMLGAGMGSLFSKLNTPLFTHLGTITLISVVISFFMQYYLIHDKPMAKQEGPAFRLPNVAMISIGIIAFCSMLGEGAMADWSTIYLEKVSHADAALAPLGLAAFALAMTIGRLAGDNARSQLGDQRLILICGVIAMAGLSIAIILNNPLFVITGFFLVGIGLSVVVPIAYSLAGNAPDLPPGVGLAMVTTVGYSGFLVGPPIIGFIADWQTLRIAFIFVLLLFLAMIILSGRVRQKSTKP